MENENTNKINNMTIKSKINTNDNTNKTIR